MAGLGRRTFSAGDILTAAQVQGYLQDQAVMVFSGTAARSTAIASPSEGMFSYLTDVDKLYLYDGSSWIDFPVLTGVAITNSTISDTEITNGTAITVILTNPDIVGGTASNTLFVSPDEKINIDASGASGTVTLNAGTAGITYYTGAATANFVIDIRNDGTANINELISTGQTLTHAFLSTNTGTAYYPTEIRVDGGTANVTTEWQGGSSPTGGNANSIDSYSFTTIKTADATFTVLASQTQFA